MKQFYVASFFFVSIFLMMNSCIEETEKEMRTSNSQIEEFNDFISFVKKDTLKDRKIQLVNSFLKKTENNIQDSLFYKTLMFKTSLHSKNKQLDSAIYFSNRLFNVSKNNNDSIYMAKALAKLGYYYKLNNEFIKAFKNYNESFRISKSLKDSILVGKRLFSMSDIQRNIGDFVGSKATAIDGVAFLEGTNELRYLSGLYHTISIALKEESKYDEALEYNARAFKTANNDSEFKKLRTSDILKFKNTKANILREQKKFKAAIYIYDALLKDSIVVNNNVAYARVLDNKGFTLWLENNDNKEPLKLMLKALELRNVSNNSSGLIASNMHLTKYHYKENKVQALEYAEVAYNNAKSLNAKDDILEALDYIFRLSSSLKREINTSYSIEYSYVNNTLRRIKSETQDIYATTKYNIENERRRADMNKINAEKEKQLKFLYIAIAAFIILLSILLYIMLNSKHKKEKLQQVYNTETRISKKVHDEVANDVYQVMTKLQSNKAISEEVLDDMESIYDRTRDISNENSTIDFNDNFDNTLTDLVLGYKNDNVNIITKDIAKVQWQSVSNIKKTIIYRVLQELMVNMKKHSDATIVVITFGNQKRKTTIDYKDNGIANTVKIGNGLRNAENRIQSINGTLTFESENNKGFRAKIKV